MKAAYLKAKYQFEVRDVELREPDRNEVEVSVGMIIFWQIMQQLSGSRLVMNLQEL